MELTKHFYASGLKGDFLNELFAHKEGVFEFQFGTAHLKRGMKTPVEGVFTKHDQNKIVFILEGKAKLQFEDNAMEPMVLQQGDFFKVDKFEGHASTILEDMKLVYVLFGKKQNN